MPLEPSSEGFASGRGDHLDQETPGNMTEHGDNGHLAGQCGGERKALPIQVWNRIF